MKVSFTHRVRYHEVDQQGFLFNARYVEIADVALTEFFRAHGYSYAQLNAAGIDPSVVSLKAEFSIPARFDDELDVAVRCLRVGRSSFDLETSLSSGSARSARLRTTYVNVDAAAGVSVPLQTEVRALLQSSVGLASGFPSPEQTCNTETRCT